MLSYLKWSVAELFTRAAAAEPEPGGGGASAISGVLGLGMLAMVAKITLEKEKDQQLINRLKEILAILGENTASLKALTQQDMEVYREFRQALSLPNKTPEEKALRGERKQQAAILAANVPLEMAQCCLRGLQAAQDLAHIGSKYAISDVGVGAHLLEAALKGALLLVTANIPYINLTSKTNEFISARNTLLAQATEISLVTQQTVQKRM